jgi:hypothetical protein
MAEVADPVIVASWRPLREPRRVALADVLITVPDGGPAARWCAELLARYPGLTLVVLPVTTGAIVVGVRDATMLTVAHAGLPAPLTTVAQLLYAYWAAGVPAAAWPHLHLAVSPRSGLRVRVAEAAR